MNERDVTSFVRRWKDVDRREAEEIREMPPETRMRLMLAAYRLAVGLGLPVRAGGDPEQRVVTMRWCRLRSILEEGKTPRKRS